MRSAFCQHTDRIPIDRLGVSFEIYSAFEISHQKIDEDIVYKLSPRDRRGARDLHYELAVGAETDA
jgi:hypothetical protein